MFEPDAGFSLGANLPWVTYGGDFGANRWRPGGGLGASGVPADVVSALLRLGPSVSIVRWFLLCDGRAGVTFGPAGLPTGLDARVVPDIDAALRAADAAGVKIVFSLIDFLWCRRARHVDGVRIHGRRASIARAAARAALIDGVFTPLFERYGRHPAIAAWEVINEPEWVTFGVGTFNPIGSVGRRAMRALIADTAAAAHAHAAQPITVGSASAIWLGWLRGLGLDFYQVHWYDRFNAGWPLATPVSDFGMDRPVVLGEVPTRGAAHHPNAMIAMARGAGYAGVWLWSLFADDQATDGRQTMRVLAG